MIEPQSWEETARRLQAEKIELRDEIEQLREAARALRRACNDTGNPVVPTPVAEAIKVICDLGERRGA